MRTIHKYKLSDTHIFMPKGARVISARIQHNIPTIWAMVEPDSIKETRIFVALPTGTGIPDSFTIVDFIDTVMSEDHSLVFHVFEMENPESKLGN